MTLHRPANVDDLNSLSEISAALVKISEQIPLLFAVHPRTRERLEKFDIDLGSMVIIEPLVYTDFLGLMAKASVVLTDSGGIQEETTALGVKCITLRNNTERPVTVAMGTNHVAGVKKAEIIAAFQKAVSVKPLTVGRPRLWDGHAGNRIVDVIESWLLNSTTMHSSDAAISAGSSRAPVFP